MGYTLNFSAVWRSFDLLLEGLALSLAPGLRVDFDRLRDRPRHRVLPDVEIGAGYRRPARAYVTIIRNTPILVLILFTYFALPQLGLALSKIESFVLTLAIYSGAYLAEVFRAGLSSVPSG